MASLPLGRILTAFWLIIAYLSGQMGKVAVTYKKGLLPIIGILVLLLLGAALQPSQSAFSQAGSAIPWIHLSTTTGDLDPPSGSTQQTAALVLDINKDGLNDLIVGARRSPGPSMVWYRRHANGWERFVIDNQVLNIEAGGTYHDIDGDGDLDVVMGGDAGSNEVWWWENPYPDYNPAANWARHTIKNSGATKHHDQMFGDFDSDGAVELVFWNQGAKELILAEIPADPRSASSWSQRAIYSWSSGLEHEGLAQADVDLDGLVDIVGGGRWFKYNGDGTFTPNIIDAGQTFSRAAVGQLKSGGRPEVVFVVGDDFGRLKWYAWDGSQWVGTDLLGFDADHTHSLQIADVNRDGRPDIFAAEMRLNGGNPDAKMWLFLGDGSGGFTTTEVATGFGNHESRLADLDGDGDLDIFGKPYNWTTPRLDIWLNDSTCTPALDQWQRHVVDPARPDRAVFILPADLDGDGLKDIVSGAWWYKNPGSPSGTWTRREIGAPLNNVAAVYDFDGDGHTDVLGTQGVGSTANANFVWAHNDGRGNFTIYSNVGTASGDFLQGVAAAEFVPGNKEVALSWHRAGVGVQALDVPASPLVDTWLWRQISTTAQDEGLSAGDIDRDGDLDLLLGTIWLRNDSAPSASWFDDTRRYRLPFTIAVGAYARNNRPVEFAVNFTTLLSSLGAGGTFDPGSLRAVELDGSGSVLNGNVPFQFDPEAAYDPASNAAGTVILLLDGQSAANTQRNYHLYFDTVDGGPTPPVSVTPRVILTDGVIDEGQASYQIQTNEGTYYYQKDSGGFSSLVDADGNDWISHNAAAGAAGDFRGIPNLVHPNDGGFFHPGRSGIVSSVVAQGPLKATIYSKTADNAWETLWEIYPGHAQLTVLKAATDYWFLYEGTPGGLLETATDFVVRSDGTQTLANVAWTGDLAPSEWSYFADPNANRSLYFVHHEDDALTDSYYPMEEAMTVFGFGRDGAARYPTQVPSTFTLGFSEQTTQAEVEAKLNSAAQPLTIAQGATEGYAAPAPSGPWSAHTLFSGSGDPDRNRLVDINGNGRLDAVIGYEAVNTSGKLAWYEQPASATDLWTEHLIANVIGPMSLDVADMDGDTDPDVVVGEHNYADGGANARVLVFENPGNSSSIWTQHLVSTGDEHHDGTQLVDVDNDGDLDIISIGWTHNRVLLYENLGCSAGPPSATPTNTPAPAATSTPTPAATNTPVPGATNTPTPTNTAVPTATNTPAPGGCTPDANNILSNPGFEAGTADWSLYTAGSVGSFTTDSPAFQCLLAARLAFSGSSSNMQFFQRGFPLQPNTDYVLSFAAYANSGHDLSVYLHRHTSPYTNYGINNVVADLSTSWQTFTIPFRTGSTTVDPRLRFWFTGNATSGDVYWIDDVRLVPAGSGPAATPTNTPLPTATNTPVAPTATNTPLPTATNTPVPAATNTPTATATNTPVGPTATNTPLPTATNTPVAPTATNTPLPTATNTAVPTATNTPLPTATNTPLATATNTAVPTATNTPAPGGCTPDSNNILSNPGFEAGTADWSLYTAGSVGSFTTDSPAFQCLLAARLAFSGSSSNMQFFQRGFPLQPNTDYVLSFAAYANSGHDLSVYLHRHTSPYTNYGINNVVADLSTSWQTFTIPFRTGSTTTDPRLRFWFTGNATSGDVYWIDDVRLVPAGSGPAATPTNTPLPTATNTPLPTATNTPIPAATNTPTATATNTPVGPTATNTPLPTATNTPVGPTATNTPLPTATNTPLPTATNTPVPGGCAPVPGNVLSNPGFEDGTADWRLYTAGGLGSFTTGSPAYECNLAAQLAFSGSSSNMQFFQYGFTLQPNTDYVLSFAAYSNSGHDLSVYVHRHTNPYTNYGLSGAVADLSTSWETFTIPFRTGSTTTDPRLRFWFVGNASSGDMYWIDDVRLVPAP